MTVPTQSSDFYDAGALKQVAINLFYGWGYNFYRHENQLRADDQMIRARAAGILGQAHLATETAESAFRRERLPPPSRENPLPDPQAVKGAQALERLSHSLSGLLSRLHALPVPENDRMTQRYRQEAATLRRLGDCDEQLIGRSELLRGMIDGRPADWIIDNLASIEAGIGSIQEVLRERQSILA